jgi:hypothetical protein
VSVAAPPGTQTKCDRCGTEVVWARTEDGRPISLERTSSPDGYVVLGTAGFEGVRILRGDPKDHHGVLEGRRFKAHTSAACRR